MEAKQGKASMEPKQGRTGPRPPWLEGRAKYC